MKKPEQVNAEGMNLLPGDKYYLELKAPEILAALEEGDDPKFVKEALLSLNQLYFNGLIERRLRIPKKRQLRWEGQEEGLRSLCEAGTLAVGSFYDGSLEEKADSVKEKVFAVERQILRNSSGVASRGGHLFYDETFVLNWGRGLCKLDVLSGIEAVVPVTSDGFEPAFLAADIIGTDNVVPVRYSRCKKKDQTAKVPRDAPIDWAKQRLGGKDVLVVEGIASTGISLREVIDYVAEQDPSSITFSTVRPSYINLREIRLMQQRIEMEIVADNFYRFSGAA